jgi:hypothetical protein
MGFDMSKQQASKQIIDAARSSVVDDSPHEVVTAGVPGRAAQAKTGVAEAERTLAAFEAERAELVARRDADVERRRQIAFDAHAGRDREARKRLDALHDEAVQYDSRLAGA